MTKLTKTTKTVSTGLEFTHDITGCTGHGICFCGLSRRERGGGVIRPDGRRIWPTEGLADVLKMSSVKGITPKTFMTFSYVVIDALNSYILQNIGGD